MSLLKVSIYCFLVTIVFSNQLIIYAGDFEENQNQNTQQIICEESYIFELINMLKSADDEISQDAAAEKLGKNGGSKAVLPLIEVLKTDKSDNVRRIAAEVLGMIGDARAVLPLIDAMKTCGEDWPLRRSAVIALGRIGDERAVLPLIEALKTGEASYQLEREVAHALVLIGDERALIAMPMIRNSWTKSFYVVELPYNVNIKKMMGGDKDAIGFCKTYLMYNDGAMKPKILKILDSFSKIKASQEIKKDIIKFLQVEHDSPYHRYDEEIQNKIAETIINLKKQLK